ncbi:MAG TPA: phosphoglycolate phosphatase [Hyphomonadaceae bacterium]|nr:phosphoglycolate phosphatase [Hyphomonadaceae bacterium]
MNPSATLSGCTIAFDLDGTLVDSAPDMTTALNKVLAKEGLPAATLAETRNFVGQGARALMVRAFAVHKLHPDPAELDRLTEAYISACAEDVSSGSKVYEGLVDALEILAAAGARLCICTNKRTDLSVALVRDMGLTNHFAANIGSDAVKNRKPHPDHFVAAIRAAGGDPARALMVGDSSNDVNSAKAAGAPVLVYGPGYSDTAPELLGADAVFYTYADLPDLAVRMLRQVPRL